MKCIKFPTPSTRALAVGAWLVAGLVLILIVWMLVIISRLSHDAVETQGELDEAKGQARGVFAELTEANVAQDEALKEANRRLRNAGKRPVPTPATPEVVIGERGQSGATGETGARGLRGEPGADGRSIVGPAGPPGRPGSDGVDGQSIVGPPGPVGRTGDTGKDGQSITGPKGDTGDRGPEGPAGPAGPAGADSTVPGPVGPQGIPGVIRVATSPACDDLLPSMKLSLEYDPATQTVTLICA